MGGWGGWGVRSAAPIDEMKQVNFSFGLRRNEKQMSRRVTESVCVLSARANVSDGSYLALCSTTVYYPKVAGWCWEEERTGSPFVIHHSGGLLPLLSDLNTDKCSSCLQMPALLNEQQAQKMIPLLSISVQVSSREDEQHQIQPISIFLNCICLVIRGNVFGQYIQT